MIRAEEINKFVKNYLENDFQDIDLVTFVDSEGKTLLHHAVRKQNPSMTMYLIEKGCKVDTSDDFGNTPLMLALNNWDDVAVGLLLEKGADILVCNRYEKSPLKVVLTGKGFRNEVIIKMFLDVVRNKCSNNSIRIAKMLLKARCPIPRAILLRDVKVTEYMLDNGSSVSDRDYIKNTALHYAVSCTHLDNVKLLVERGADVGAINVYRETPLHLCDLGCDQNNEIVRFLLCHGASLMAYGGIMEYPVAGKFLWLGGVELVKILLDYNLDFSRINADGKTLLHHVIKNKNSDVFNLIQSTNFDVNFVDNNGNTLIFLAIEQLSPIGLEFLLKNGAGKNITNFEELTFIIIYFLQLHGEESDKVKTYCKCFKLLILYEVSVETLQKCMFSEYVLKFGTYELFGPFVEQIAIAEATNKQIGDFVVVALNGQEEVKNYFDYCRRDVENMKSSFVYENVTVFELLTVDVTKLEMYARNEKLVQNFNKMMTSENNLKSNIPEFLEKRVEKAVQMSRLRQKAANCLTKVNGLLGNIDVMDKIIVFFDYRDLINISMTDFERHCL